MPFQRCGVVPLWPLRGSQGQTTSPAHLPSRHGLSAQVLTFSPQEALPSSREEVEPGAPGESGERRHAQLALPCGGGVRVPSGGRTWARTWGGGLARRHWPPSSAQKNAGRGRPTGFSPDFSAAFSLPPQTLFRFRTCFGVIHRPGCGVNCKFKPIFRALDFIFSHLVPRENHSLSASSSVGYLKPLCF